MITLRITPLGVGDAFSDKFFNTNFIISVGGKNILLDAGTTLRYSLPQAGFSYADVDGVVITHLHGDHVGGLEEFAQRSRYQFNRVPDLYATDEQLPCFKALFGLGGVSPDFYLNVKPVGAAGVVLHTDGSTGARCVLRFIPTTGFHSQVKLNYAIEVAVYDVDAVRRVLFTGDIADVVNSGLYERIVSNETVAVLHDCFTHGDANPAHTSLKVIVQTYPPEVLSKIHLVHYGDNVFEKIAEFDGLSCAVANQGDVIEID